MSTAPKRRKTEATRQLRDNIRLLTNEFRDWVDRTMSPEGLTVPQLRLLYAVQQDSAASSAAIARHCQVTPQTLQGMLERAVRQGWIVRTPAAANARILTATLTPKGAALLTAAKRRVEAFEAEIWRDSSAKEMEAINAAFAQALRRVAQADPATAKQPRTAATPGKPKAASKPGAGKRR